MRYSSPAWPDRTNRPFLSLITYNCMSSLCGCLHALSTYLPRPNLSSSQLCIVRNNLKCRRIIPFPSVPPRHASHGVVSLCSSLRLLLLSALVYSLALLSFGASILASINVTSSIIDRRLRRLHTLLFVPISFPAPFLYIIEHFPPSGKGKGGSKQSRARSIMGLRDIEFTLPPGFRFHPSDEELLCHYLYRKVTDGASTEGSTMVEVDLHAREPWELPDAAKLGANEWYFFSFRDRKYATGSRTNRATRSGYWKATGKDRLIYDPSTRAMVGLRKTLVFYTGRAPHGAKTNWVMHEFRLETPHSPPKEDWVLCRVFHKRKGEAQEHGYKPGSYSPNNVPDHHMNSTHLTRREEEEEEDYFSSSPLLDMCSARDFPQMGMGMASTPLMECGDHDEFAFLFDLGLEQGFRLPRWQD